MKSPVKKTRLLPLLAAGLAAALSFSAHAAAPKQHFNVCWTIYPVGCPGSSRAPRALSINGRRSTASRIDVTQLNDYVESINQYTAGQFDGCTMTNMDALTIPAAGGLDSTALIVSDFSNGNDGIVLKGEGKTLADSRA